MKLTRIYAMILRFLYIFKRSVDRLADVFYWPLIDLILWGLTGRYVISLSNNDSPILLLLLSGLIFWIFVWRSQNEITINLLEDLWNKNLVNIFAGPLKFSEWIVSFVILGFIKGVVSFSFAAGLAFIFYKVNIIQHGMAALPYAFLLIMSGWWVGFTVSAIILRFGTKIQNIAWSAVYVLSPFSGIYYSIDILPGWAQAISKVVPMSYIFEGIRETILTGVVDGNKLLMCLLLNTAYLILAILFLQHSFNKVLDKGLVKVY